MKRKGVFLAVCVFSALLLHGQEAGGDEATIEEYYLSQDIELRLIQDEAFSNSEELKLLALRNLERMVDEGRMSDEDAAFAILETLATETISREVRVGNRTVNNFPEVRRQACNLLGRIGGEKAKDSLLTVVLKEEEPMVVAEAVYALGRIGLNENEEVTNVLAYRLHQENIKPVPDNNLAFSTLLAVEKLAQANDGVTNPELINAIGEVITQGNYVRMVKLKALSVLEELRKIAVERKR
ncbi:HEAT repeat domain-containing protein [Spirochaeta thermophila]|uniref:PBS lyase HEAT domain protein repeat-containing protein n=1 Tax=Winmispira thermophila (strain ATCC 49972 / DSM 6192 / RI 19.B1) TaxID=665571 RepID=E0RSZ4_WINT6|nr:HEAT repeat domain-containing protein [Spirochaeta thermophila]ADN02131.1 hypothetical protein STHERM_c11900 [Spirochaeta thermophila DSM 6192]